MDWKIVCISYIFLNLIISCLLSGCPLGVALIWLGGPIPEPIMVGQIYPVNYEVYADLPGILQVCFAFKVFYVQPYFEQFWLFKRVLVYFYRISNTYIYLHFLGIWCYQFWEFGVRDPCKYSHESSRHWHIDTEHCSHTRSCHRNAMYIFIYIYLCSLNSVILITFDSLIFFQICLAIYLF